jgi:hypothetical protein
MRNYTVRVCFLEEVNTNASKTGVKKFWWAIWDDKGYSKKYTLEEAEAEVKAILEKGECFGRIAAACRIYKGREMVKEFEA